VLVLEFTDPSWVTGGGRGQTLGDRVPESFWNQGKGGKGGRRRGTDWRFRLRRGTVISLEKKTQQLLPT